VKQSRVDAVVVGSGVGGLCAAARLTARGMKVLVVEKSRRLGGRCSHYESRGFKITTGAMMIPMGEKTAFRQTFDALDVPLLVRPMADGNRYRLPHGEYEVPAKGGGLLGMLQFACRGDEARAQGLYQRFVDGMTKWQPLDTISFRDWLAQYTDDVNVHKMYQGFCAAFIGVNADEVPAGEFFRFLTFTSRKSQYGIAIHGNGQMMEALAAAIAKRGAEIRRSTACRGIVVRDGLARGVVVGGEGEEELIEADFVISNVGPAQTVGLAGEAHFERSYLALLHQVPFETPVVHISFATDEPLAGDFGGILNFGNTESLIYYETASLTSADLAPAGRHLTTTYSVARDSTKPDLHAVTRAALRDLEANFPGFSDKATILVKARHQGDCPAMRRLPGHTMPVQTPIENLFNVGDGCMPAGSIGVEGAAMTAVSVAEAILARHAR